MLRIGLRKGTIPKILPRVTTRSKTAWPPKNYPPKYQTQDQIEFYKNNPKPAYYELFYDEIRYEVNTQPLEEISHTIMDMREINFAYFDQNSLIKFAWLYRSSKIILNAVVDYLKSHVKIELNAEEFATLMFLNSLHGLSSSVVDIFIKFEGYLAGFNSLDYMTQIKLASFLVDFNIVVPDICQNLMTKTKKFVLSEQFKELSKNPDDLGVFLFFLNKWVSSHATDAYLEEVMSPKVLGELSRYLNEDVDFEFRCRLTFYLSRIAANPMNLVMTSFLAAFMKNL
jgi:hypothetical protein